MDSSHGDFRDELDYWTMTRKFENGPNLNEDLISSDPTTRIFQVDDEDLPLTEQVDKLWCQIYHDIKAERNI